MHSQLLIMLTAIGFVLFILAMIWERFSVYRWHPDSFSRGVRLTKDIRGPKRHSSPDDLRRALVDYLRERTPRVELHAISEERVLLRTSWWSRFGYFRADIRTRDSVICGRFFISYMSLSSYLFASLMAILVAVEFGQDAMSIPIIVGGLVVMDVWFMRSRVHGIATLLVRSAGPGR